MFSINSYKNIFWDFDGVIKDSLEIKTNAFYQLFQEYGIDIANKVKEHHLLNGGMSRYEKMPIYLKWSGCQVTDQNIKLFCKNFATKGDAFFAASTFSPFDNASTTETPPAPATARPLPNFESNTEA